MYILQLQLVASSLFHSGDVYRASVDIRSDHGFSMHADMHRQLDPMSLSRVPESRACLLKGPVQLRPNVAHELCMHGETMRDILASEAAGFGRSSTERLLCNFLTRGASLASGGVPWWAHLLTSSGHRNLHKVADGGGVLRSMKVSAHRVYGVMESTCKCIEPPYASGPHVRRRIELSGVVGNAQAWL